MKADTNQKTVLWAVDPYSRHKGIICGMASALKVLAQNDPIVIEPIYILKRDLFDVPKKVPQEILFKIQRALQKEFSAILRKTSCPVFQPINILPQVSDTVAEQTKTLLAYAHSRNTSMIALTTQARKGLGRWVMGSFAENLSLISDIPLYLINPRDLRNTDLDHILFATDFSSQSKKAFLQVLPFAVAHGSRVTLFHKSNLNWMVGLGSAYSSLPVYRKIFEEDMLSKQVEAGVWAEIARKKGVKVKPFFNSKRDVSASEAIVKFARKEGGIIALAGQSGKISSVLLGSVARKVIREASVPVWIVRSESK